ncbi:hypothetical protein M2475_000459 [Breznakia sp. PF5-3]|nr:hypothetical protein [Breznakia sp. PM6-1]MDF9834907.1 hypothetical protein [Breznakia sp. PF5-3]MDF9837224.1 hypothetical protein [Breznakia sp. PFB2-8]MDF9859214.1 hypothetical protein [Breznakia sp. PH5-24]
MHKEGSLGVGFLKAVGKSGKHRYMYEALGKV